MCSYLSVFKGVHNEYGKTQSKNVSQETGVEVSPCVLLQTESERRENYCKSKLKAA